MDVWPHKKGHDMESSVLFCDRSQGLLGLTQKEYINKVLEIFRMKKCYPRIVSI